MLAVRKFQCSGFKGQIRHDVLSMCLRKNNNRYYGSEYKPIAKVLVANRGEIAVRVFRACSELGIRSVAIYSEEDGHIVHQNKANEAYLIGRGMSPINAYLNIEEIITIAKNCKADAIHPGYGFLSEKAEFAQAVIDAGLRWIGPSPKVVKQMGDKMAARTAAVEAGVSVVPGSTDPMTSAEQVMDFCKEFGLPIILKAAHGGGGRGMRVVHKMEDVVEAFNRASSEALSSFGHGAMFIEKFIDHPRHIEVQLLGDRLGNIVHLFERDCSVQRRHSKVVEVAPAPNLDPNVRARLFGSAISLAKFVGYENAGTVEFLMDKENNFYFIEVNARLQLEHTISEEITSVDIVQAQIRLAEGATLQDLHLTQDNIKALGTAIQCHITTEDPSKNFEPDNGKIELFRSGEGMGIRLDGASGYTGAIISPHYDSLLVKIIAHAPTLPVAAAKLIRALKEFRIRGVKTNIPFLLNVLVHPTFLAGGVSTSLIDENPQLFDFVLPSNRGRKLLDFIGETLVNGPKTPFFTKIPPSSELPEAPHIPTGMIEGNYNYLTGSFDGFRQIIKSEGPEGFMKAIRAYKGLLLTDTTVRDGNQSLLFTRFRTIDLLRIAPFVSTYLSRLYSYENWGGATFNVALQFLYECPWERLERMRELMPNIPFQMILRGTNLLGYTNYPDNAVYKFCKLAVKSGIDIIRVYDPQNYLPNLLVAMDAANKAGAVVEGTVCYAGRLLEPNPTKFDLKYYMDLGDTIVGAGAHVLCIKDMAGLLTPASCAALVSGYRKKYPHVPIHVHTHDTPGIGLCTIMTAAAAGADVVDVAADSMAGIASQPSMGAIVASLEGTSHDTGIKLSDVHQYSLYWEKVRHLYGPFDSSEFTKSTSSYILISQIPGGQYTNLRMQAESVGLGSRWREVRKAYSQASRLLGDIIKVTPTSKVVGEMAQFMVQNNLSEQDVLDKAEELSFPKSVVNYFQGHLGQPYGGFPEPLRTKVLKELPSIDGRIGEILPPVDFEEMEKKLKERYPHATEKDAMSYLMYPDETDNYLKMKDKYGPVDRLETKIFLVGPKIGEEFEVHVSEGRMVNIRVLALSTDVTKEGQRELFFEINGSLRSIHIDDEVAKKAMSLHPKASKDIIGEVGAPMPSTVVEVNVSIGDKVEKGAALVVLSAMKMEMVVRAPVSGTVSSVLVVPQMRVKSDDLLVVLD